MRKQHRALVALFLTAVMSFTPPFGLRSGAGSPRAGQAGGGSKIRPWIRHAGKRGRGRRPSARVLLAPRWKCCRSK